MHFFIVGATGRVGKALLAACTGHQVTALVRRETALPGATTVIGDVLDARAVARAITGDVIITTVGGGTPKDPGKARSTGTQNLIAAARAHGISRIMAVVGAGVLLADATRMRHELAGYPSFLASLAAEHLAVYRALAGSELDWTCICVPDILDGGPTGTQVAKRDYLPDGTGKITAGDIAAFIVREAMQPTYPRARVGLNTRS